MANRIHGLLNYLTLMNR